MVARDQLNAQMLLVLKQHAVDTRVELLQKPVLLAEMKRLQDDEAFQELVFLELDAGEQKQLHSKLFRLLNDCAVHNRCFVSFVFDLHTDPSLLRNFCKASRNPLMRIHLRQHALREGRQLKENQKEALMAPLLTALQDIDHVDHFHFQDGAHARQFLPLKHKIKALSVDRILAKAPDFLKFKFFTVNDLPDKQFKELCRYQAKHEKTFALHCQRYPDLKAILDIAIKHEPASKVCLIDLCRPDYTRVEWLKEKLLVFPKEPHSDYQMVSKKVRVNFKKNEPEAEIILQYKKP